MKTSPHSRPTLFTFLLLMTLCCSCSRSQNGSQSATPQSPAPQNSAVTPTAAGKQTDSSLNGHRYAVTFGEKGKPAYPDTLLFSGSTFRSTGCDQYGFTAAPYTTVHGDNPVTFASETHSAAEGTMKWTGTITGDGIDGTVRWEKGGQNPIDYVFKGTRWK